MKKLLIIILITLILQSFGCNREYTDTDTEPIDNIVSTLQGEDDTALNGVDLAFRIEPVDVSKIVYYELAT